MAGFSEIENSREKNLSRLLHPRHACYIGGRALEPAIRAAKFSGFSKPLWVVHPTYEELGGIPCCKDIAELPEAPDAVFLGVPKIKAVQLLSELDAKGAGGVICYAAGFAETGETALQADLVKKAGNLAVVGPNCYGILNHLDGLALWPIPHQGETLARGVAFIAQSGNIALNISKNDRSVPLAYTISTGNQAVLGVEDFLKLLAKDEKISAIGLYIEGIRDVAAFAEAAEQAHRAGKPLIALKAGRSDLGQSLARSHTASLAGEDSLYDAFFARLGIIRARSLPQLMEMLKLASLGKTISKKELVILTCSGGDGLLAADKAADLDIALPAFSGRQRSNLRGLLPDFANISNPLDYNTSLWGKEEALRECFAAALEGRETGMLIIDYATSGKQSEEDCDASVKALLQACRPEKKNPLIASTLPELLPPRVRDYITQQGGVALQGLEDALEAFAAFAGRMHSPAEKLLSMNPSMQAKSAFLSEHEAKQQLKSFGVNVPKARLVLPSEVLDAAADVGYPLVLKIAQPVLAHKTDQGAVAVNLKNEGELLNALAEMQRKHRIESLLVEEMVEGALAELIVGIKRSSPFGLALLVGAGGSLTELIEDRILHLLPARSEDIAASLNRTKIAQLLNGYRNKPKADMESIFDAILRIVEYALQYKERLVEMDINPLLILPDRVVAADALILMADA